MNISLSLGEAILLIICGQFDPLGVASYWSPLSGLSFIVWLGESNTRLRLTLAFVYTGFSRSRKDDCPVKVSNRSHTVGQFKILTVGDQGKVEWSHLYNSLLQNLGSCERNWIICWRDSWREWPYWFCVLFWTWFEFLKWIYWWVDDTWPVVKLGEIWERYWTEWQWEGNRWEI